MADAPSDAPASPRSKAEMRAPGKILLATDFSKENIKVVQFACERLLREGDTLVMFKTMIPQMPAFDAFDAGLMVDQSAIDDGRLRSALEEGEEFLAMVKETLLAEKKITAKVEVEVGDPGEAICEKAVQEGFNLVVVGSHSKTQVQSFLVGSVSNYLLHHCEVPVVIVRM
ncbi:hypothetical protein DFJ74DRAFT_709371 [Hyaloraphidium curvatum]|nr:hypothetical protein DFJ74DRAFT_709371 [Hyaloraphidium curvatum]